MRQALNPAVPWSADGGTVRAALGPAGYAPLYGMVTDRFGVTFVLDLAVPYTG